MNRRLARIGGAAVGLSALALAASIAVAKPAELAPLEAPAADIHRSFGTGPGFGIEAIARADGRLIVGGDFAHIGPPTGPFALLNAGDGSVRARLPAVGGAANGLSASVNVIIDDGAGGMYIGGAFGEVGGLPRQGLARVLASGEVDPRFRADVRGAVDALEISGAQVYVGGSFDNLSGRSRLNLGAVDATTGAAVEGFDAAVPGSGIDDLAVGGNRLYIGGDFATVGGVQRRNLAAVSLQTGAVDRGFDPSAASTGSSIEEDRRPPDADGPVYALALSGSRLFVGGRFTAIGATSRSRLASLDAASGGVDTAFDPAPDADVHGLFVDGDRLYVSGFYDRIAGVQRDGLAAVHPVTGVLDRVFVPDASGVIEHADARVYVGGQGGLVALDRAGNRDAGFDATPAAGGVRAVLPVGDALYVGGSFAAIGGRRHEHVAALNTAGGAVDETWQLSADGPIEGIERAGGILFLHGAFTRIGGRTRHGLAAIDARTQRVIARFRPPRLTPGSRVVVGRSRIYVFGGSKRLGRLRRGNGLFAIDKRTGRPIRRFGVRTQYRHEKRRGNGTVEAVAERGRRLYVGGRFTHLNGRRRNALGAVHVRTGRLLRRFRPRVRTDYARPIVERLYVRGRHVYAIGFLSSVSGRRRANFARLRLRTGRLDGRFRPPATRFGRHANLSFSGRHVYLAQGVTVQELDVRTGAVERKGAVSPEEFSSESIKQTLPVGNRLYVVGTFGPGSYYFDAGRRPVGIAAFDLRRGLGS
jgi:hypothetical protein